MIARFALFSVLLALGFRITQCSRLLSVVNCCDADPTNYFSSTASNTPSPLD